MMVRIALIGSENVAACAFYEKHVKRAELRSFGASCFELFRPALELSMCGTPVSPSDPFVSFIRNVDSVFEGPHKELMSILKSKEQFSTEELREAFCVGDIDKLKS